MTETATADRSGDEDWERFSDPLQSFGHLARVTFRTFARNLESRTLPHGISIGQWRFLRELWREDGITQRELSTRLDMREPSTVAAVRSLENAGLVRRQRDKHDRRKIRVHLTAKAKRLRSPLLRHVSDVNAIATAGIPARDLDTARRVMLSLIANLNAASGGATLTEDAEP
ncbi:MAG: MarR family transcriptional regulator [Pseudomonadales bacterium]|jgi:DNA-binding MarR family transcriptional regulator